MVVLLHHLLDYVDQCLPNWTKVAFRHVCHRRASGYSMLFKASIVIRFECSQFWSSDLNLKHIMWKSLAVVCGMPSFPLCFTNVSGGRHFYPREWTRAHRSLERIWKGVNFLCHFQDFWEIKKYIYIYIYIYIHVYIYIISLGQREQ